MNGWRRKCALTINHGVITADLNDFPVLFTKDNLPSEIFDADGGNCAKSDGSDIRFSSDSAGLNLLAREIASFKTDNDPANGQAEIWVKIPSIYTTLDVVIYLWYGNEFATEPASTDTYGSQNVWDANYVAVWHVNGAADSTGKKKNSESNDRPLVEYATPLSQAGFNGVDDGAYSFNGVNEYCQADNPLGGALYGTESSIEVWFQPKSWPSTEESALVWDYDNPPNDLTLIQVKQIGGTYHLEAARGGTSTSWSSDTAHQVVLDTWYYGAMACKQGQETYVFQNDNSPWHAMVLAGANVSGASTGIKLGANAWGSWFEYFQVYIDEVRISNIRRINGYFSTSYRSMASPGTFVTAGTPVSNVSFVPQVMII